MSRRFLPVAIAALLLAVLGLAVSDARAVQRPQPSHQDLLCVACHTGALSDRREPHVPDDACLECHLPGELEVGAMGFDHLAHRDSGTLRAGCAGCHNHASAAADLSSGYGECVLCHQPERDGDGEAECSTCHRTPPAQARTSQGVELPHGAFQWMDDACLRCHFDLSAPPTAEDRCTACHEDGRTLPPSGSGEDLHEGHLQVACGACHEVGPHRIEGMSAAVRLPCGDCHAAPHGVDSPEAGDASRVCNTCHESVHQAQQRLFLGVTGGAMGTLASPKFLSGLSCRSCHDDVAGRADHGADPATCGGCHDARYGVVAGWWKLGGRDRATAVRKYVGGARAALREVGLATGSSGLDQAEEWIGLVETGGAQHNPALSHRLLGEALVRAEVAYRMAMGIAPAPPALGGEPRPGQCSYCHFDIPFQGLEPLRIAPHDFIVGAGS